MLEYHDQVDFLYLEIFKHEMYKLYSLNIELIDLELILW
jgi:hypothetical protein